MENEIEKAKEVFMKNNHSHWRVCLLLSVVLCAVIMKTCLGVNAAGTINWNFMDGTLTISGEAYANWGCTLAMPPEVWRRLVSVAESPDLAKKC